MGKLVEYHRRGCILSSVCAGIFILAGTGLLEGREVTTHWELAGSFETAYPDIRVNTDRILIDGGDIITAGGLMSWLDLGLELIQRFSSPRIMRRTGKVLVVDTGSREQRYYRNFTPRRDHGDAEILIVQNHIRDHLERGIHIGELAALCALGERTFLRRFRTATGYTPVSYIQQVRIQRACELLESTPATVQEIVSRSGYGDIAAFRKIFIRITGLTPREFRKRFSSSK
jgi:transcriptional regulator GlxA family with amidase domain